MKRKQKGSKSWLKLQKKIARLDQKIADTRKDYHFKLAQRIHECRSCGYTTDRNVAASQVVRKRGLMAVGQPVKENAGVDGLTGVNPELDNLVKNRT